MDFNVFGMGIGTSFRKARIVFMNRKQRGEVNSIIQVKTFCLQLFGSFKLLKMDFCPHYSDNNI